MRVLMIFPEGLASFPKTSNLYQVWGLHLRLGFIRRGCQVDVWPAGNWSSLVERAKNLSGSSYDFAVIVYYSGALIGDMIDALRVAGVRRIIYFNESSADRYTKRAEGSRSPDFYYEASLYSREPIFCDELLIVSDCWRIIPPFRTLPPPSNAEMKKGIVLNGPLPPRYIVKFGDLISKGMLPYVSPKLLIGSILAAQDFDLPIMQLVTAPIEVLAAFVEAGQPRPFGHPDWEVAEMEGLVNVPPVPLRELGAILDSAKHFIVSHLESFCGLVLDALSKGCVVHYPVPPIMYKSSLVAMRNERGYATSLNPNMRSFGSVDELIVNLRESVWRPAPLASLGMVADRMLIDVG